MNFIISKKTISTINTDALVVFGAEEKITPEEKETDKVLSGQIAHLRKLGDFAGKTGEMKLLMGGGNIPRLILIGIGKAKEFDLEKLRAAISQATLALKTLPVKHVSIFVPAVKRTNIEAVCQQLVEAISLSIYEFSEYKKPDERKKADFQTFELFVPQISTPAKRGALIGEIISRAVNFTRDLGNHPSNIATPSHLAEHALRIAREDKNIKVRILHKEDIKKERMGGLLAVAKGSDEEPKFIILEYKAKKLARRGGGTAPTIALVGKGITFDSGGISIKPSEKMEEMKYDMAGGATVMGIIKAASELKLPVNLVGLIPATENLPSGKAIKPGDIVVSRNGKTIEIVNTDAEGRLILADALDYAKQYKPALVLDFATLTGAIVVALGDDLIGAFTNNPKKLSELKFAADMTGEKIWPMPLVPEYEQFIKSDFADLRNIGMSRYGDSINAANFLQNFVDYPWIHLDIAGVAWATREKPYRPKGATGTGIRMTIEFLRRFRK